MLCAAAAGGDCCAESAGRIHQIKNVVEHRGVVCLVLKRLLEVGTLWDYPLGSDGLGSL